MKCSILAIGASALALQSVALSAQTGPTDPVKQTSPWRLDAGEEKCRLAAVYGDAPEGHILFIEQDQPGSAVGFAIGGPSFEGIDWEEAVAFQFGELPPFAIERYSKGDIGPYQPAVLIAAQSLAEEPLEDADEGDIEEDVAPGIGRIPVDRFLGVSELRVMQDGKTRVALALPNFKNALEALNRCSEGFITYWGLDLEKHRTMTRGVKFTNLMRVARSLQSKYPSNALRRGEQGTVRFLVLVDEQGKVTDCRQSDVTALDRLDSPVCREMRRARFEPALDADGKPMKSYYSSRITYLIP